MFYGVSEGFYLLRIQSLGFNFSRINSKYVYLHDLISRYITDDGDVPLSYKFSSSLNNVI